MATIPAPPHHNVLPSNREYVLGMPPDRPDIVLITTDQQRFDTINALGASHMETPHLDRLVREGITFTNCHITAPSCAPARASLFTGEYPHTSGVHRNGERWPETWISDLAAAGYYTANIGKMHTAPYDAPTSFDERHVVENKDRYLAPVPGDRPRLPGEKYYLDEWDKAFLDRGFVKPQRELYRQWEGYEERLGAFTWEHPESLHPDVFVGQRTVQWLDTQPALGRPLFLTVGFPGPHPPYDPVDRWLDIYREKALPEPVLSEDDLAGQPAPLDALRNHMESSDHDSTTHDVWAAPEHRQRQRAHYFANVSMIDEQIGNLLETLEANGYDDVVVIFTSDHGDALGDHGHIQKWTMYDVITRVPTIVWAPDRFDGNRRIDRLCQWFDIGPTVLDLAETGSGRQMAARSLLPGLEGQSWAGREHVFAEHRRDGILQGTACMSMVRSERWKLVHFVDNERGQLFDLEHDPKELENLWDDPDVADVKSELLDRLHEWRIEAGERPRLQAGAATGSWPPEDDESSDEWWVHRGFDDPHIALQCSCGWQGTDGDVTGWKVDWDRDRVVRRCPGCEEPVPQWGSFRPIEGLEPLARGKLRDAIAASRPT